MSVKGKLEALLQIEQTETIQNVFRSFHKQDIDELYETIEKYFKLVLKIYSEVQSSTETIKFYLEKQMYEVVSSLFDYCKRIKVIRNFSGIGVTFGFEQFRAEVNFDFSSRKTFISLEDLQKMHELTNNPCVDSVEMRFTEGSFFDKVASGLVEIEGGWGRQVALKRLQLLIIKRCLHKSCFFFSIS